MSTDERDVLTRAVVGFIEWRCFACGDSGPGFMPAEHASRACEVTKTEERPRWSEQDILVRRPFRLVPEVVLDGQRMVRTMLDGALYMDGAGI